jgi:hypothetical protein
MLRQEAQMRRSPCPIRDAGIESGIVVGCLGTASQRRTGVERASTSRMPSGDQDGMHE